MKRSFFFLYAPLLIIISVVVFFFRPFFLQGLLPIPSDTVIGLYHPFRDLYAKDYPRGIPFKNFLITDPVRQQYPWRKLAISLEKKLEIPLWNPYNAAGTPLLANFQTGAFYPLNIFFFILPFSLSWSFLVVLQMLLAGIFMFAYLIHIRLSKWASLLGAIVFSFSGFSISWLEWNTIGHVGLWLPLILLSIDKIFTSRHSGEYNESRIFSFVRFWSFIFIFSLTSSFFAGHLQTFFYLFIFSIIYFFSRWIQNGKDKKIISLFIILYSLFFLLTAVQWFPTLQFILNSARNIDQANAWQQEGWFLPWQHLIQFIVPDFFGNPTTLNYWGVWNYAEFIGYIGIFPLIMALFALFFRHDKKTLFFGTVLFISLVFSLPSPIAKLPYLLNVPFLSTSQPTRLLFLIDFSLAILSAFGLDFFLKKKKEVIYPIFFVATIFSLLWLSILSHGMGIKLLEENLQVAKSNLILPTGLFILSTLLPILLIYKKGQKFTTAIFLIIFGIIFFDLLRFGLKFTPFTEKAYLFPPAKTIAFLQNQPGIFRIMVTDDRILPPNFSVMYRLQGIDVYDPLYLRRFGELLVASERGKPDITSPFGFNRIIVPHRYDSKLIDLLGVKYVLSLSDITSPKLTKVFQEGETRVYENSQVLPRTFFVKAIIIENSKEEIIKKMFLDKTNLLETAIIEEKNSLTELIVGKAEVVEYGENRIIIKTQNSGDGFLVFTDSFYPTWKAKIDGIMTKTYRTDYNFRGIFVPNGKHTIEFKIGLL